MPSFKELVEDYSRHKVPDNKTVGGIHIGIIVIGVSITITAFILGSQMGLDLGFWKSLQAFYLGGFLLAVVAGFTGAVGASQRLSTAMIIKNTFGESGAIFVNSILTLVMMGWCMVLAAFFGDALHAGVLSLWGVGSLPRGAYVGLGSVGMAVITIFGFKALDKQSLIMVPMMLVFLFVILYLALQQKDLTTIVSMPGLNSSERGLGSATSIVVGSFIAGVTVFPDVCRYVRSHGQAVLGAFIAFFAGYPVILVLSAIPSIAMAEMDLMKVVVMLGFTILGFIFLILASLTTGTYQLYSASLAAAALFRIDKWKLVILIAIATTYAAIFFTIDHFLNWLTFLSILIPPISGIYVTHAFMSRRASVGELAVQSVSFPALGAWVLGASIAYLTNNDSLRITAIAAIDGILVASLGYYALQTCVSRTVLKKNRASD